MKMMKALLAASALLVVSPASAAPIFGSFSLTSFSGTYVGGTATTATGLDFGDAFGGSGNGYGTNGTALVGNALGSFSGLSGSLASISDLALVGNVASPYTANPFLSFAGSNIVFNFDNASLTRSPLGTSVTITGKGTFTNGIAADASAGTFSLATSSQNGLASDVKFTFTSNASVTGAVPEPGTWAMMLVGFAMVGAAVRTRRRSTSIACA